MVVILHTIIITTRDKVTGLSTGSVKVITVKGTNLVTLEDLDTMTVKVMEYHRDTETQDMVKEAGKTMI